MRCTTCGDSSGSESAVVAVGELAAAAAAAVVAVGKVRSRPPQILNAQAPRNALFQMLGSHIAQTRNERGWRLPGILLLRNGAFALCSVAPSLTSLDPDAHGCTNGGSSCFEPSKAPVRHRGRSLRRIACGHTQTQLQNTRSLEKRTVMRSPKTLTRDLVIFRMRQRRSTRRRGHADRHGAGSMHRTQRCWQAGYKGEVTTKGMQGKVRRTRVRADMWPQRTMNGENQGSRNAETLTKATDRPINRIES
eukprot:552957-Pleurochrysis_carterae.AAC.4